MIGYLARRLAVGAAGFAAGVVAHQQYVALPSETREAWERSASQAVRAVTAAAEQAKEGKRDK